MKRAIYLLRSLFSDIEIKGVFLLTTFIISAVITYVNYSSLGTSWSMVTIDFPRNKYYDMAYVLLDPLVLSAISGIYLLATCLLIVAPNTTASLSRWNWVKRYIYASIALLFIYLFLYGIEQLVLKPSFNHDRPKTRLEHQLIGAFIHATEYNGVDIASINDIEFKCPIGQAIQELYHEEPNKVFTIRDIFNRSVQLTNDSIRIRKELKDILGGVGAYPNTIELNLQEKLKQLGANKITSSERFVSSLLKTPQRCDSGNSCPSGHMMRQVFLLFICFIIISQGDKIKNRMFIYASAPYLLLFMNIIITLIVGWSRVYGYHHTVYDEIWSFGLAMFLVSVSSIPVMFTRNKADRDALNRRQIYLKALDEINKRMREKDDDESNDTIQRFILEQAITISRSTSGTFFLKDPYGEGLELTAQVGISLPKELQTIKVGQGVVGMSAKRMEHILLENVFTPDNGIEYICADEKTKSELAVPLCKDKQCIGIINLESQNVNHYKPEDISILSMFADIAVVQYRLVAKKNKFTQQLQSIDSLRIVMDWIANNNCHSSLALRLLLTGITSGAGLAFSRAILFLMDESGKELKGDIAIGAIDREEANSVWSHFENEQHKNSTINFVRLLEHVTRQYHDGSVNNNPGKLEQHIRSINIDVYQVKDALAKTLGKKEIAVVNTGETDYIRSIISKDREDVVTKHAFLIMPLRDKEKVYGVLYVDNRFLVNETDIESFNEVGLSAYVSMITSVIKNANIDHQEDFLRILSHEIKDYVQSIIGNTQLLAMESNIPPNYIKTIKSISSNGENLAQLANHVLNMFRLGSIKLFPTTFNIRSFIDSINDSYRVNIELKGVKYKSLISDVVPKEIVADRIKIRTIIRNLLTNALKYTNQGEISLKIDFKKLGVSERLLISVQDTGIGIKKEDQEKLFGVFVQLEDGKHFDIGTGLGLSITKRLVQMMNGTIKIDSIYNSGTLINVEIDVQASSGLENESIISDTTRYRLSEINNPPKVLIIDDNKDHLDSLYKMLSQVGYRVQTYIDAEKAIKATAEWEPDLAIVDFVLPHSTGYDVISQMSSILNSKKKKFIMLTGKDRSELNEPFLSSHSVQYLQKPIEHRDLLNKLKEILCVDYRNVPSESPESINIINEEQQILNRCFSMIPIELLQNLRQASLAGNIINLKNTIRVISEWDSPAGIILERMLNELSNKAIINAISNAVEMKGGR